jgi:hypothetical protein
VVITPDGKIVFGGSEDNYIYWLDEKGWCTRKHKTGGSVTDLHIPAAGLRLQDFSFQCLKSFFLKHFLSTLLN